MKTRREVLIGGALLTGSAAAYGLTPRHKLSLLQGGNLNKMIPRSFGGWKEVQTDALVVPEREGSLASRLYSETVGRVYQSADDEIVMLLIAYGDTQSDQLQLHRPETCYPAVGFQVHDAHPVPIPVAPGVSIPGRRLVASSAQRREQVMYWTRLGEHLPASSREQHWVRLRTEMAGVIADGALVRLSAVKNDDEAGFRIVRNFAGAIVKELPAPARRALMGTSVSQRLGNWA